MPWELGQKVCFLRDSNYWATSMRWSRMEVHPKIDSHQATEQRCCKDWSIPLEFFLTTYCCWRWAQICSSKKIFQQELDQKTSCYWSPLWTNSLPIYLEVSPRMNFRLTSPISWPVMSRCRKESHLKSDCWKAELSANLCNSRGTWALPHWDCCWKQPLQSKPPST